MGFYPGPSKGQTDSSRFAELARKAAGGSTIGTSKKLGAKDVEAVFAFA